MGSAGNVTLNTEMIVYGGGLPDRGLSKRWVRSSRNSRDCRDRARTIAPADGLARGGDRDNGGATHNALTSRCGKSGQHNSVPRDLPCGPFTR